jgi:cysteine synthase B
MHFVACLGPTGTFVGVGRYLRSKNPFIYLVAVQPDSPFNDIEGVKHLEMARVPEIWGPSLLDHPMTVAMEDA